MRSNDEIIDLMEEIKNKKNISISELARRVGMAKSAVSKYFKRQREFPLNRANEFAKALGIEPDYLLGIDFKMPTNAVFVDSVVNIPIIGNIAAGTPILAEQNIEGNKMQFRYIFLYQTISNRIGLTIYTVLFVIRYIKLYQPFATFCPFFAPKKNSHTHNRAWLAEILIPSPISDIYPFARGISSHSL